MYLPPPLNLTTRLKQRGGLPPVMVQIIPHLGVGGAEQAVVDMAQAIRAAGGQAVVIAAGGSPAKLQDLKRADARYIHLPVASKNPWTMVRNIGRLKKTLRDLKADVVHVRSRAPAWSAYYAARALNIPFMTTAHAPYLAGSIFKKWYNRIMGRGDRVIAISDYVAGSMRAAYGVTDDRLRIIPRSVDLEKFNPGRVTPDRLIRMNNRWRVPDGATVILLPGRLTRWKGQMVLIEAMAMLKDHPDIICVLQGSDQGRTNYAKDLHTLVHLRDLEGRIRIVDHDDDVPAMYMAAHIIVSASTEPEGFGRVAIEGMSMGRVVIATNHGGSRETIDDGVTGFLVPPNDPAALARSLTHVLKMPMTERAAMGVRGMNRVKENFTRTLLMERTLAVYNELL